MFLTPSFFIVLSSAQEEDMQARDCVGLGTLPQELGKKADSSDWSVKSL